ncbi:MAG TPA: hypothetical protein VM165_18720 [Planctomycetaceae bacterium]|nr:hypothetical protein [Planctomycetaceae bacterium]
MKAKSDKLVVQRRIQDVTKLVLAGAEFGDLRQFAADQGWNISDRQLRRYLEAAYQRMAKATRRDRQQLLGRHLIQRRALYARAVKTGDLWAALQMLRDEAALAGLYPGSHSEGAGSQAPVPLLMLDGHTLTRRDRVVRRLEAEWADDRATTKVIERATPVYGYYLPDTQIPTLMLHILTQIHVNEQLETGGLFQLAAREALIQEKTERRPFELVSWHDCLIHIQAYLYRVRYDGWRLFTERLGLDGQRLIENNYAGQFLAIYDENLLDAAPEPEKVRELGSRYLQTPVEALVTAEDDARSWHNLVCTSARVSPDESYAENNLSSRRISHVPATAKVESSIGCRVSTSLQAGRFSGESC